MPYNPTSESKLAYLYRTKLFIPLNYKLLALVSSNESLNPIQKIIWLDFYARCYRSFISSGKEDFSFFTTYPEMMKRYALTKPALSKLINRLVRENFIFKKQLFRKSETGLNDRQDQSIWQITLSLPMLLALHMSATQDRKGISLTEKHTVNSGDGGINLETGSKVIRMQSEKEQGRGEFTEDLQDEPDYTWNYRNNGRAEPDISRESPHDKTAVSSAVLKSVSCTDPHVAGSSLYINKNTLSNISKSDLGENPKVTFNDFSKNFKKQKYKKTKKEWKYNICAELIRQKLKTLPQDKADKARKFAYSLVSRKLAKGYAENLSKHELAKQIIFHAASWKPREYGYLSKNDQIDVALAVAWKTIVNGTWQAPLGWVKSQTLQYEFEYYEQKYQETGVLSSHEITNLERAVSSLLGSDCHNVLVYEITRNKKYDGNEGILDASTCRHCRKHGPEVLENIDNAGDHQLNVSRNMSGKIIEKPVSYSDTFLTVEDRLEEEQCYSEDNAVSRTDFSILPNEQRLCMLTTSDEDNSIILETAARKQYLVRAKALERNSSGEMVIVLQTDPAIIFGNTDTCIDKTLSDMAFLNVTGKDNILAANALVGTENPLIQEQELSGQEMLEYLPGKFSCATSPVLQDSNNKVQTPASYNCNNADFIDYAKLLDEE